MSKSKKNKEDKSKKYKVTNLGPTRKLAAGKLIYEITRYKSIVVSQEVAEVLSTYPMIKIKEV